MASGDKAEVIYVFLASPGDVGEERSYVRQYLENDLPNDPLIKLLPHAVKFEVVCWDHPSSPAPMPHHLTPQQAVDRFKRRPADCDIVFVILASRMGTHLDTTAHPRPGGGAWLSGTEWEFENARVSDRDPKPEIFVYRRTDVPPIDPNDQDAEEKLRQNRLVQQLCAQFTNADRSSKAGFDTYKGVAEFQIKAASCIKHLLRERYGVVAAPTMASSAATAEQPVASIPLPDRCFGRDADTAAVVAALVSSEAHIAVLVQGPGGIGKTTLTQQAANHDSVIARFGARRWFVELETATDRDTFDAAILLALGLDATQGFDAALNRLAQERTLLVLDNLETPWGGDSVRIEQRLARLAAVPGLVLLASFRGDEAVGGVRWSLRHTVEPLPEADARALFFDIARRIPGDDQHMPELLAALGGVPLAISLTTRRAARHDNLAELWTEWRAAGTAVAQLPGAAPGRLTSVPHSIEFSLRSPRLTEAGRRLFRLLGQLPAGIADVDRLVLLGGEALAAREEVQGLGLAFIRAGRLDLLPPVREHARREYDPPSDNEAWLRHYLSMIENLGTLVGTAGGIEAIQRLSPELPNIEAAVDRALGGVNLSAAVAASHGLSRTLRLTGLGSPRILIALAEACASSNDPTGEASCLKGLADLALIRSDLGVAWSTYEDALQLYRRVGDVFGEANCIRSQGEISLRREHYDAAYSQYEAAMWLFRRMGDVEGEGNCLLGLGNIAFSQSVYDVANAHYRAGLEYFRWNGSGHVVAEAGCLAGLGRVALANRDLKEARVHFEEALEMFERAQSVYNIALAHEDLASVTRGAEREFHIAVSKEHWSAMKLPENAAAVDARFRPPKKSLLSRIAGLLAIPTH